jgi:hypothetical protein
VTLPDKLTLDDAYRHYLGRVMVTRVTWTVREAGSVRIEPPFDAPEGSYIVVDFSDQEDPPFACASGLALYVDGCKTVEYQMSGGVFRRVD